MNVFEGAWDCAQPVYMCFELDKAFDSLSREEFVIMGYSPCYYGLSGHCTLVRAVMNRKAPECLGCFRHVQLEGADLGDNVSGLFLFLALNSSVSPMNSFYLLTSYKSCLLHF